MKYIIYKHTIINTNKSYIGFTVKTMEQRLHKHWINALSGIKTKFYNALNKYGIDSIESEILCYTDNEADALDKEAFYIEKYDTYKIGYNSTIRGGGGWLIGQLSEERQKEYYEKKRILSTGENNPNHSGKTDEEIIIFASELFRNNNYVYNTSLWKYEAKKNGYPMTFSKCRFCGQGNKGFRKLICEYLGIDKLERYSPNREHREKLSNSQKEMCWISNEDEILRVYKSDVENYIGYNIGSRKNKKKRK